MPKVFKSFEGFICRQFSFNSFVLRGIFAKNYGILQTFSMATLSFNVN